MKMDVGEKCIVIFAASAWPRAMEVEDTLDMMLTIGLII